MTYEATESNYSSWAVGYVSFAGMAAIDIELVLRGHLAAGRGSLAFT